MSVTIDSMHTSLAPANKLAGQAAPADFEFDQEAGLGETILTVAATAVAIIVVAMIAVLMALA